MSDKQLFALFILMLFLASPPAGVIVFLAAAVVKGATSLTHNS